MVSEDGEIYQRTTEPKYIGIQWGKMGKMKNPGMPQFWLLDPSSSRLPVARPRHGRIRLIQCQVGKVMLDQFTRSYAQTLDSRRDISLPVPDPDADM